MSYSIFTKFKLVQSQIFVSCHGHLQFKEILTVLVIGCVSLLLFPMQVNSAAASSLLSTSTFIVFRDLPGAISSKTLSIRSPFLHQVTRLVGHPEEHQGSVGIIILRFPFVSNYCSFVSIKLCANYPSLTFLIIVFHQFGYLKSVINWLQNGSII